MLMPAPMRVPSAFEVEAISANVAAAAAVLRKFMLVSSKD
jgi:hypothetical protein